MELRGQPRAVSSDVKTRSCRRSQFSPSPKTTKRLLDFTSQLYNDRSGGKQELSTAFAFNGPFLKFKRYPQPL